MKPSTPDYFQQLVWGNPFDLADYAFVSPILTCFPKIGVSFYPT
ncbi:MAG: hypothetical protein QG638_567 [Pseudomonadota bacterium]|nr:hypothetical protein [Pseudomonadota bacterium]